METFCILNSALNQILCFEGVKIPNINMCAEFQSYSTKLSLFFAGITEKMKKRVFFHWKHFVSYYWTNTSPTLIFLKNMCFPMLEQQSQIKKWQKFISYEK